MGEDPAGPPLRRTRRRRKRSVAGAASEPPASAGPSPASVPRQAPDRPADSDHPHPPPRGREARETERGLRAIVGAGPSQIPATTAMRVRDAARPTVADLAEAERETQVVHRHWTPPT